MAYRAKTPTVKILNCHITYIMSNCCNEASKICSVPFVIREPGKYTVGKNLIYDGTGPAISIVVSGVTLDFNQRNLTLTNNPAVGVSVDGVNKVVVQNGSITAFARSTLGASRGVSVLNSRKVIIRDMLVKETGYGIRIITSQDVQSDHIHAQNNGVSNFRADNSVGITLANSAFDNVVDDLAVAGVLLLGNVNVQFHQNNLHNSDIFANSGNGILFNEINSVIDDPEYFFGVVQLGSTGSQLNNAIIRNSNFTNSNSLDAGPAGAFITSGNNILIENCNFECNRIDGLPVETATIAVGGNAAFPNLFGGPPNTPVTNLRFVNSNIKGVSAYGILVAGDKEVDSNNRNTVFDNVNVADALVNVQIYANDGTTIKNSNITNGVAGVVINSESNYNSLLNNTVSSNLGVGILLEAGSNGNNIRDNNVFNNIGGIVNEGTNVETDNVVYDNDDVANAKQVAKKVATKKYDRPTGAKSAPQN